MAVFVTFANILSYLPISFAGIGTREATLVYLFATVGISSESALAFSVLLFSCSYLLIGIIGFIAYMVLKLDKISFDKDA